jgi:hypothetical protein
MAQADQFSGKPLPSEQIRHVTPHGNGTALLFTVNGEVVLWDYLHSHVMEVMHLPSEREIQNVLAQQKP